MLEEVYLGPNLHSMDDQILYRPLYHLDPMSGVEVRLKGRLFNSVVYQATPWC